MKSMTGFGSGTSKDGSLILEVSGVNRKGLEVFVSLPKEWAAMERLIVAKAKNMFSRGRINVSLKMENNMGMDKFNLDEKLLEAEVENLKKLCGNLHIEFKMNCEMLLKLSENLSKADFEDWKTAWTKVEEALDLAFAEFDKMKIIEANAIKIDFEKRLTLLENYLDEIKKSSADCTLKYIKQLMSKIEQLDISIDSSDERLLKEVAIYADKCDISEELTRIKSHIGQFKKNLDENYAVGRKLDFLCQELGREINTLSSKASNIESIKSAIEFKNELERIREQVQNVE